MVSQFIHSPTEECFEVMYQVITYLKGSPGKGFLFNKKEYMQIEAYTDADWAGENKDRRSISSYYTFVEGNLVTQRSKKQNIVARSGAKAESQVVAHELCELIQLKRILEELRVPYEKPMKLYYDNKAVINATHNPIQYDRTKHVEVDYHFIKEKLGEGLACMPYVLTKKLLANVLTKDLQKQLFEVLVSKLEMLKHYRTSLRGSMENYKLKI